jgi:hypothetical protein
MRRFLMIAFIFVGGVVALMVASLVLQQHAGRPVDNLRTTVAALREALADWDYGRVLKCTDGIPMDQYELMFDRAHAGGPDGKRWFAGVLSAMDAYPSVRFDDVKPDAAALNYEVRDGSSRVTVATSFVPGKEGGWFLRSAAFRPESAGEAPKAAIAFGEGDNISLVATADRLFETLVQSDPASFRALMVTPDNSSEGVLKLRDSLRAQVVSCRDERLRRMLPTLGKLPRGTRWLQVIIAAKVDDKPLRLDFAIELGPPLRIGRFACAVARERAPAVPPAELP